MAEADERYAEGKREPSTCRKCKQPVTIVFHGPNRNHTVEKACENALRQLLDGVEHYFERTSQGHNDANDVLEDAVEQASYVLATKESSR